jgi:5'-methylthioadenosine phosphorylase
MTDQATLAVIGGSGLYSLFDGLDDVRAVTVETPYGPPSEPPTVATVAGRSVAFLPRHGRDHRFPPHRVPYRANLWALRTLGVRQVLAPSAVGSLRPDLGPGRLVVPDQVVDRTKGRDGTYYDEGAVHLGFADPYCPAGRAAVLAAAADRFAPPPVDGGTMVVIEGPRFSSRAESQWHAAQGWTVVGMTGMPEAALARELGLCFTALSLVTDHDAGTETAEAVSHQAVLDTFAASSAVVKATVLDALRGLPEQRTCPCADALDGLRLPFSLP